VNFVVIIKLNLIKQIKAYQSSHSEQLVDLVRAVYCFTFENKLVEIVLLELFNFNA
jgi:hypothetical protein